MRRTMTLEQRIDRFWSRVKKTQTCWEWSGADNGNGYGVLGIDGRIVYAHRFSFELSNGPIESGLFVCHRCDNRRCVRPSHLFAGTQRDNIRDMMNKGRAVYYDRRGERNPNLKLSSSSIGKIRELRAEGKTLAFIASMFGVGPSQVHRIASGKQRRSG